MTSVSEYKAALPELGRVWRRHFGRHYPAMGLFGVTELFSPELKVELMGVAVLPRSERCQARDRHLSEAQLELYERTRALAATTLGAIADAGTPGEVNRPLIKALADHGLLDVIFASEGDISAIALCLIREALARECPEAETAFALQGLGAYPILQAGSPAVRERWVAPVADGTAVAAFALTEPEAGSDPAGLSLRAEPDGDGGYRLSGEKLWISNAPEADLYTVFARGDRARAG